MTESRELTDTLTSDHAEASANPLAPISGPSPNPATNLLIREIILRSSGRVAQLALAKAMLSLGRSQQLAREAAPKRSLLQGLAAAGVTRLATRSVPGFLIVGTGLAAKTLFDRSQSRRKARREREQGHSDTSG